MYVPRREAAFKLDNFYFVSFIFLPFSVSVLSVLEAWVLHLFLFGLATNSIATVDVHIFNFSKYGKRELLKK